METERKNENIDETDDEFSLDLIELENTFNRYCRLVERKNELKEEAYMRYGYNESMYIDWLLTNKIEEILK